MKDAGFDLVTIRTAQAVCRIFLAVGLAIAGSVLFHGKPMWIAGAALVMASGSVVIETVFTWRAWDRPKE